MNKKNNLEKKILTTISKNISRWQNVSQKLTICGQEISIKPKYLSVVYREKNELNTHMLDAGLVLDNAPSKSTGMFINSMIGDEFNGYSSGSFASQGFSRNPKQIYSKLDNCMDYALKYALAYYLEHLSNGIVFKNDKEYTKLSKEDVAVYQDEVLTPKKLGKKEIALFSEFSKSILRYQHVTGIRINAINSLNRHFFVDSELRNIFHNNYSEILIVDVDFDNDLGVKKKYFNSFLNPDYANISELFADLYGKITDHISHELVAQPAKSGQYPVIFGPSASGTLFHEGLGGHLLSGAYICEGVSTTFRDKLGEKIMPLDINIIDNPLDRTANGYYLFDDEGISAKKTILVENGILKNYLLNRNSAAYFNTTSNGHSRSEWVLGPDENGDIVPIIPEPRTSNMEIYSKHGVSDDALEKMMLDYCKKHKFEYGLYIDDASGLVDIETSMFRIEPNLVWRIYSDGRRERITNAVVIGSPYELLQQIAGIGNTSKITLGLCGADSGGVSVQESAPAIFLPKVTVTAIEEKRYTKRLLDMEKD